jgi:hypothetical protein
MGFSLQALDEHGREADDYLSLSNAAMRDLRELVTSLGQPPSDENEHALFALSVNQGEVVNARQCGWLADRLRRVDRQRIEREEPEPEELLELVDALTVFCEKCAGGAGFEVW